MTPQLAAPQSALERLPEEWAELLEGFGQPRYRALQVFHWIHRRGVMDPRQMSDLPKSLRERLIEAGLGVPLVLAERHDSSDGTQKLVHALHDGRRIESVLIPRGAVAAEDVLAPPEDDAGSTAGDALAAVTQCISSQVGCAMACAFCASGLAGLKRQLSAGEIVAQVLSGRAQLIGRARLAGLVFMGMGEPLHNYDAVARAIALLSHPEGVGLSPRRMTVSTSGLIDGIEKLGRDFGGDLGLAISIHASDDATRSRIMPINKRHPLASLLGALRRYPARARNILTVEYTLLQGVNDSLAQARELARLLRGLRCKVNLIPMNPVDGTPLQAPAPAVVAAFQRELRSAGLEVFVRKQRGDDIAAACGQLALKGERRKLPVWSEPPRGDQSNENDAISETGRT
jgi:23S rRNA (adenine2503-C2)-methyltransferase